MHVLAIVFLVVLGQAQPTVTNVGTKRAMDVNILGSVDGGVSIGNLPAVQPVSGSVAITNLPRTLNGAVSVSAAGAAQESGNLATIAAELAYGAQLVSIDGGVSVANFPAVQPVSGSVAVSNLPRNLAGLPLVDGSRVTQPVVDAAVLALLAQLLANQTSGIEAVQVVGPQPLRAAPLNPFLLRCNAVRTSQCQP